MSATPARILIVSPNWIGDAVMAQPLVQQLRVAHPQRAIDVLAPATLAAVWRAMPQIDQVIETAFAHRQLEWRQRWRIARALRQRDYALAYVLPNSFKSALIPWLARIPKRIGYLGEQRYGLLNVIHRDADAAPRPMVVFYAALSLPPAAVTPPITELPRPTLRVASPTIRAAIERLQIPNDTEAAAQSNLAPSLHAGQPWIVFAPGAEFGSAKRWPPAYFAELARTVAVKMPGMQIALLGSAKDRAVCAEITALAPHVINLAGRTNLDDSIALIAAARAVVSNDSGLLHIASALNRPLIAIYGPTDPLHAPPFSDGAQSIWLQLDCAPCRQRECPLGHHRCMREIGAAVIWEKLRGIL